MIVVIIHHATPTGTPACRCREVEEDRDVAMVEREKAEAEREHMKDRLRTAKRDLARAQKDLQELLEELRLQDQARKCCYLLRG